MFTDPGLATEGETLEYLLQVRDGARGKPEWDDIIPGKWLNEVYVVSGELMTSGSSPPLTWPTSRRRKWSPAALALSSTAHLHHPVVYR